MSGYIQLRPQHGDERFYSPNGDLAHNFIDLLKRTAYGLDPGVIDKFYADYMSFTGCTFENLGECMRALVDYVKHANDPKVQSPKDALELAGFFSLPESAQLIVMAKLGQIVTCAYFTRTREANDPNVVKVEADKLMEVAEQASKVMMEKLCASNRN